MFDFLRNLTKSAAEKRQEMITAYLDDTLSASARARFEAELAQDSSLQADLERERAVKQALNQLPQRRVPKNFTLDPARYGRPAKQPLVQAYPVLRAATGLTAFFFIFALVIGLYTSNSEQISDIAFAPLAQPQTVEVTRVVTETIIIEAETEVVEVTRVVTETVVETVEVEVAPEFDAAAEELMAEEAADEEMAAEGEESVAEAAEEEIADDGATGALPPEPSPQTTASPPTEDNTTENGEDVTNLAPVVAPTSSPTATSTDTLQPEPTAETMIMPTQTTLPTATTSMLPRATATSALNRGMEATAIARDETANTVPDADAATRETAVAQPTTEPTNLTEQPPSRDLNLDFTSLLLIGLFSLFIILLAVTLYARRQL